MKLWDEMMIRVEILNVTKVVSTQFKKLYTNDEMESKFKIDSLNRARRISRVAEKSRREELRDVENNGPVVVVRVEERAVAVVVVLAVTEVVVFVSF